MKVSGVLAAVVLLLPGIANAAPCAPFVEVHSRRATATLRAHVDALETCTIDETTYSALIADWLATCDAENADAGTLFLGRAVNHPWLSSLIAEAALPDRARTAQSAQTENAWLARLMSGEPVHSRLDAPFRANGFAVVNVSVEKVLWGRAAEHTGRPEAGDARVPFDAMVWLGFARAEP